MRHFQSSSHEKGPFDYIQRRTGWRDGESFFFLFFILIILLISPYLKEKSGNLFKVGKRKREGKVHSREDGSIPPAGGTVAIPNEKKREHTDARLTKRWPRKVGKLSCVLCVCVCDNRAFSRICVHKRTDVQFSHLHTERERDLSRILATKWCNSFSQKIVI